MSSQLIKNLVRQAQSGDAESFGELYNLFANDMYRFAVYYTSSHYLAQDAVGDAALEAFEQIKNLKKAESFKSWLFKILFVCCKNQQKEKAKISLHDELSQAENLKSEPHDYIRNYELQKAMSALSQEEREIVILSFACGYKSEEIGKMLGLKPSTVRSKLSRAAAKIRNEISEQ